MRLLDGSVLRAFVASVLLTAVAACDSSSANRAKEDDRTRAEQDQAALEASVGKLEEALQKERDIPRPPREPPLEPLPRQIEALLSATTASAAARPPPSCKPCPVNDPLCACR